MLLITHIYSMFTVYHLALLLPDMLATWSSLYFLLLTLDMSCQPSACGLTASAQSMKRRGLQCGFQVLESVTSSAHTGSSYFFSLSYCHCSTCQPQCKNADEARHRKGGAARSESPAADFRPTSAAVFEAHFTRLPTQSCIIIFKDPSNLHFYSSDMCFLC